MTFWTNRLLDEVSVYWDPPIRDGLGGYTWIYPIEVSSRWQKDTGNYNGPTIRYLPEGTTVVARTIVWVNHEVELGGYLYKGSLSQVESVFSPLPDFDVADMTMEDIQGIASQIVTLSTVRSIPSKNRKLIQAYLDES